MFGPLLDLLHYLMFALLAVFTLYVAVRVGTLAVLQSIDQFRRRQHLEGQ